MKLIKLTFALSAAFLLNSKDAKSQLFIDNSDFMIGAGAFVTVQGDVESNVDIFTNGANTGLLLLKGTDLQNVNMQGKNIPNLELDNNAGAELGGDARIAHSMLFTLGKITLHDFNLRLSNTATITGQGPAKFAETNKLGELQKEVTANLADFEMPVGNEGNYNPVLATTTGPYNNAVFGVRDVSDVHPQLDPQATNFLENHWPITQSGITQLRLKGNYIDPAQVHGSDLKFSAYFWQDAQQAWSSNGAIVTPATNFTSNIVVGNGDLYAMNAFGLLNAKVLLQGAYDANTNLMRDNLRSPAPNVIPLTDPYRVAPFNFTHVKNPNTETITDPNTVFANQPLVDNNIVDWVYIEVRKPANTVIATRSALVQRDGDIVDVDGVSPVYINELPVANDYTVAVRHRNHLGIATDVVNAPIQITETGSTLVDFTTMTDAQIFGPATAFTIVNNRNLLWGGNANFNNNVRFNGLNNDKDQIFLNTLNGNPAAVISPAYHASDVNMNKNVRFNGLANDKDFLFLTVLDGNPAAVRLQSLPQ